MITQQQALEALEALRHAGPDGWGPIEHFTTLRQYIEQGAQPGADVVMTERQIRVITFALHRFVNHAYANANAAAQDKHGNFYSQGAATAFLKDAKDAEELLSKKPYATLSAAPQPQQEQSNG